LNLTGLDSYLYISWFAFEFCLSVTVLCCSTRFMTRMEIEQLMNLKFLVTMKKEIAEIKRRLMHWRTPNSPRMENQE
jgi:hypothetical protein